MERHQEKDPSKVTLLGSKGIVMICLEKRWSPILTVMRELLFMQLHEIMHIYGKTAEQGREKQILQTEFEGEKGCCQLRVQTKKQL